MQKQARQLKVDSNSKKFLEAIRLYWMPRLLEKMEQNSSSSSASTSSSTSETPNLTAPPPLHNNDHPVLASPCPKPNAAASDSDSLETSELITASESDLCGENFCAKSFVEGCYHVDIPGYDMQELGCEGISMSECHASDMDWFGQEIENSFWNSDELWQFRKLD